MPLSQQQFDPISQAFPDMNRSPAAVRARIELMERFLEGLVTIPGTRQRIGADALIGIVPVVGDLISTAMGAWIVWEARNLGMSKFQIARMAANVGVDTVIGAVPLVGDLFDVMFRSNKRNLRLIKRHLDTHHPATVIIDR